MTKHDRKQKNELKVFISSRESRCDECGENLGHDAWILLQGDDKSLNGAEHANVTRGRVCW